MKILLAKNAGYCFGVRDAVNMAYDTAKEYGDVYMLGHIVHNENVVDDLDKVQSIDDIFSNYADASAELDKKDFKSDFNKKNLTSEVDEYFIDQDSGEELTEWSDLTEKKEKEKIKSSLSFWDKMTAAREDDEKAKLFDNLESSKGQLIEELADHSIINDDLDGRIVKVPKTSWWQKLPFV